MYVYVKIVVALPWVAGSQQLRVFVWRLMCAMIKLGKSMTAGKVVHNLVKLEFVRIPGGGTTKTHTHTHIYMINFQTA